MPIADKTRMAVLTAASSTGTCSRKRETSPTTSIASSSTRGPKQSRNCGRSGEVVCFRFKGQRLVSFLVTGIAAKTAEQLGTSGQQMDSFETPTSSKKSDLHQIIFAFLLGIIVGMIFLRFLQTCSIYGTLHRLSSCFRYIWRFTYFVCRTLSLCIRNRTGWFRRHQNSVDRIYDRMASKGKGKGRHSWPALD